MAWDSRPAPDPNEWDIKGYYGRLVSAQANAHEIPNADGIFDIYDVSDPLKPIKKTGLVGSIGVRYALYYIANYGLGGHSYRIIDRRQHPIHSFLINL